MVSEQQDRIFGLSGDVAIKAPVDVASLAPLVLSGEQTIDGVVTSASRVLVAGQVDASANGIYLTDTGAWQRAPDFDGNGDAVQGTLITVSYGVLYAGSMWRLNVTSSPPIIGEDDLQFSTVIYLSSVVGASANLVLNGGVAAIPVTYVSLEAKGPLNSIGVDYISKGTTTLPGQYNGFVNGVRSAGTTGRHRFWIAGRSVVEFTDTYWNPNTPIYGGQPTSRIILSSGCFNGVPGGDNVAFISIEDDTYLTMGGPQSLTLIVGGKGTLGSVHFLNNGMVHVSIAAPSNPTGVDMYHTANILWLAGSATGISQDCVIYTGNGDNTCGMVFYNGGIGGFKWLSDNAVTPCFQLNRIANAVNSVSITPSITTQAPTIQPYGTDTNAGLLIRTKGNANSNIFFYDGGKAQVQIGGGSTGVSYLTIGSDSNGIVMSAQNNGSANPDITIYTVGTGKFTLASSNTGHTLLQLLDNYNVITGNPSQGVTDTAGFLFLGSCAGPPTGVPANIPSNRVAWMYDRTNNQIYIYNGGWKKTIALT